MLAFFFVPVGITIVYSFMTGENWQVSGPFTFDNFTTALTSDVNRTLALNSLITGLTTATVTVAVGLPVAYWLHFSAGRSATPVLSLIVASMFAGYLVRIYAWRTVLGSRGIVNSSLESVGAIDEPLGFLIFSRTAVIIAELHLTLPFAVVILYAAIRPIRNELLEAAEDLGASPSIRWRRVILPLMAAPMANAWMFIFIVGASDFVTPQFLGDIGGQLIGVQVNRLFRAVGDYGKGSALAVLMLLSFAFVYVVIQVGLRALGLRKIDWD